MEELFDAVRNYCFSVVIISLFVVVIICLGCSIKHCASTPQFQDELGGQDEEGHEEEEEKEEDDATQQEPPSILETIQ